MNASRQETAVGSRTESDSTYCKNCNCRCAGDGEILRSSEETGQRVNMCLACYVESLPRLCAERGLLEPSSPCSRLAGEEGSAITKAKGTATSHQQLQLPGISPAIDIRRLEAQQTIDVRFDAPVSFVSSATLEGDFSVGAYAERITPRSRDKSAQDSSQKQSTRTALPLARDEKVKGDSGVAQQEPDFILENETIRTIIIGAPWATGRQGLPSYAPVKGDAAGNFEITIEPSKYSHMFTLEPTKGTLFAGSRQMVRACFAPEATTPGEALPATHERRLPVTA